MLIHYHKLRDGETESLYRRIKKNSQGEYLLIGKENGLCHVHDPMTREPFHNLFANFDFLYFTLNKKSHPCLE